MLEDEDIPEMEAVVDPQTETWNQQMNPPSL